MKGSVKFKTIIVFDSRCSVREELEKSNFVAIGTSLNGILKNKLGLVMISFLSDDDRIPIQAHWDSGRGSTPLQYLRQT